MNDLTDTAGRETQAERDDWLRHGSSFGTAAAAYAAHRPGYAEAAVRWALQLPEGEPPGSARAPRAGGRAVPPRRVLDLAAGTGKLTAALVGLGAEVAGQAMHWFDLDRAVPEIARVLAPGGVLAGVWNLDDDRVDWVAALAAISKGKSNITLRRWREGTGRSRLEHLAAAGAGLFEAPEIGEFAHGQRRTADLLVETVATHSSFLVMSGPDRSRLLAQVRDLLYARPETAAGEFVLPMVTVVLRARRL
jgi:hypothetical protein